MNQQEPYFMQALPSDSFEFKTSDRGLVKPPFYVDKTDLIADLISSKSCFSFCRPRRFGKTTTLSLIADIFTHGVQNLKGYKIAKKNLFKDKQFPVFFFDFSCIALDSSESFLEDLRYQIKSNALKNSIQLDTQSSNISILLRSCFEHLGAQQIVVLIDEYDCSLIETMQDREMFEAVSKQIALFYRVLKAMEKQIRFMLVTGVNKVSNLSIFSGFNNIIDISFDPKYASLVGYTEQELLDNFAQPLESIASFYKLSFADFMQQLKERYNGYCFDQSLKTTVFNTWDINSLLTRTLSNSHARDFLEAYWVNSGAISSFVIRFFQHNVPKFIEFLEQVSNKSYAVDTADLIEPKSFLETPVYVFMFNAGYLSLKHNEGNSKQFKLDFPNQTVQSFVLTKLIYSLGSFAPAWASKITAYARNIIALFDLENTDEERKETLSKIFIESSTTIESSFHNESQLRTFLIIIFQFAGLDVQFEVSKLGGRVDIFVKHNNTGFIIELKVIKSLLNPKATLEQIAKQSSKKVKEAFKQINKQEYHYIVPQGMLQRFGAIVGDCSTGKITDFVIKTHKELEF